MRMHQTALVTSFVIFGGSFWGCGPKSSQDILPPEFGFSSRFLGTVGGCQAVLFREDQILFYSECLGDSAWFKPDNETQAYPISERLDTNAGLSIATLSIPVSPQYASLDVDYSGWDRRKVVVYDSALGSECEARKDGSHTCKCIGESHPALIYSGYVIGVVDRCETLERSGKFIPVYSLSTASR